MDAVLTGACLSIGHVLLLDAWSGSVGVDAVVTALVLAARRPSASALGDGRTDPSAMRNVRGCGDEQKS
jgi:hypothetical protein